MEMDINVKELLQMATKPERPKLEYALVFWLQECKASTIPIKDIPEKDRKEGCQTQATWGSSKKRYEAKVIKISGKVCN